MFIEKRKQGKKNKYYLIHTYRIGGKVKRISRYLGSNLTKSNLERLKKRAEKLILEHMKEKHPFDISDHELKELKKYEKEINIEHLHKTLDWEQFTKDFTYDTNAIEGSTVTYEEAEEIIDKERKPEDSDERETLNVAEAVNLIRKTKPKLSLSLIKKIHIICFKGTKHFAGNFRDVEVAVMDGSGNVVHRGTPAKEVEELLKGLIVWYEKHHKKISSLLLAALVHNQFEKIHPFQDGNGRVGRLLLNYVLLQHGYPPLNIKLEARKEYYRVLQDFQKTGDIESTLKFLISQYRN
jgi:Fic family protein